MAWRLLELLAAAERADRLLVMADELRELLDALGWPVDSAALLADFGVTEADPE